MRIVREFPRRVVCHEDMGIVMPDGVRLSARLWLPEDAGEDPVPLILEHLPYRKRDGTVARDAATHPYLAGHGYACLRVDMRGTGDSGGLLTDEYTDQEWRDACDVIAWGRAQPWCTGAAGMMGISWGGFNALQVAALRPEGLRAVISICSTADRFADDIHMKGGAMLGENLGWAAQMLAYSSRPPDPAVAGEAWRAKWLERLEALPFLLEDWLAHQRRDAYWARGSVCEDWGAIEAAVLAVGGWHDGYRNTPAALVANLHCPVKGIVGPWIHKYPHLAGPEPAIGFLQEALRWWDRWLKGAATGVEDDPAMRLWLMDGIAPAAWLPERPGRWIAEPRWPAPGIAPRVLHLTDSGLSETAGPLVRQVASPADCGAAGGEYFPFAFGPELPLDQRGDDALSACFDSAPGSSPLDIVGAPRVTLRLAASAPQGQIAVRLCDVFPDGTSALVTLGVLNLAHRGGHAKPAPVPPGEPVEVTLDLDQIAYRLAAGHRLRLAVSTAYWPFLWPAPGPVTLTLLQGRLALPVRPGASGPEWRFEPPETAPPWDEEILREGSCTRRREVDLATGASVMVITNDAGARRDRAHGLVTSERSEERWSIRADDPASARADIRWEERLERGEWQIRTECTARLSCDAETFFLEAEVRAWEGADEMFVKSFAKRIDRDNL